MPSPLLSLLLSQLVSLLSWRASLLLSQLAGVVVVVTGIIVVAAPIIVTAAIVVTAAVVVVTFAQGTSLHRLPWVGLVNTHILQRLGQRAGKDTRFSSDSRHHRRRHLRGAVMAVVALLSRSLLPCGCRCVVFTAVVVVFAVVFELLFQSLSWLSSQLSWSLRIAGGGVLHQGSCATKVSIVYA
jgi:hypothetical protein